MKRAGAWCAKGNGNNKVTNEEKKGRIQSCQSRLNHTLTSDVLAPDALNPQPHAIQQRRPLTLRPFAIDEHCHHRPVQARLLPRRVNIFHNVLVDQELRVAWFHRVASQRYLPYSSSRREHGLGSCGSSRRPSRVARGAGSTPERNERTLAEV